MGSSEIMFMPVLNMFPREFTRENILHSIGIAGIKSEWMKSPVEDSRRGSSHGAFRAKPGLQLSLITAGLQSRGSPFFTSSWNCSAVPLIFLIWWDTFKMGTSADPWRFLHQSRFLSSSAPGVLSLCSCLWDTVQILRSKDRKETEINWKSKKGRCLRSVIYDSLLNYNLETLI